MLPGYHSKIEQKLVTRCTVAKVCMQTVWKRKKQRVYFSAVHDTMFDSIHWFLQQMYLIDNIYIASKYYLSDYITTNYTRTQLHTCANHHWCSPFSGRSRSRSRNDIDFLPMVWASLRLSDFPWSGPGMWKDQVYVSRIYRRILKFINKPT